MYLGDQEAGNYPCNPTSMRKQYVNAKRNNRTLQHRGYKWLLFILVLLLLSGVLLLRYLHTDRQRREALVFPSGTPAMDIVEESTPTEQTVTVPADSVQGTSSLTVTEDQAATPEAEVNSTGSSASESSAAATNSEPGKGKSTYNEQTYQLVTDIVHLIRNQGTEAENRIRSLVAELKASDPDLGALWERITDYWFYAASDFTVNPGKLPDGLPQDDSLGIVVLGFQLLYDGEMAPELQGRCETALACARKYPNAYLIVTGGGTAPGNREATEAGVMADWFIAQGVNPTQIITEKRSLTTDQNATYSCTILAEQYPQIKELAIVSSDYHVALGCMLFTEAALLYADQHDCNAPYQVVSNAGFATTGNPEYSNPMHFASDMWIMANPGY